MDLQELIADFGRKQVLIVGDVMMDAYLTGDVNRISPEAPVPVVEVKHRDVRLGGAANVALNIKALGACPILCSVVGKDVRGRDFLQLLEHQNLPTQGIVTSEERMTTVKYRIIGNRTQLLRVDEEVTNPLSDKEQQAFLERFDALLAQETVDIILFQDYDKGVITPEVIRYMVQRAKERGIPTCVDPKKRNFHHYQGITLFKPNLKELSEGIACSVQVDDDAQLRSLLHDFREKQGHALIFVTLSEKGVVLYDGEHLWRVPAHIRNISDVSGAGDTVISVAALCLAVGLPLHQMAALANLAGGLVCESVGVISIDLAQFIEEIKKHHCV